MVPGRDYDRTLQSYWHHSGPYCHPTVLIVRSRVYHKIEGQKPMTLKQDRENLAQVKLALADKYENLAATIHSKPRKVSYLRHVDKFRRQAADLRNLNK
jgi:hypothetical protein